MPMPTLSFTWLDVTLWVVTCVAMAILGTIVWKVLQRQEAADPELRKRLDEDDARARRGRGE